MHRDWITRYALSTGVAVPFLYYGSQAAAAPFFPGFSFLGTTASELGSELSRHPAIFNDGSILQGIACLVASFGFLSRSAAWAFIPSSPGRRPSPSP